MKCVICGELLVKVGHNADPVKQGVCCDKCNREVVIPARDDIPEVGEDWFKKAKRHDPR